MARLYHVPPSYWLADELRPAERIRFDAIAAEVGAEYEEHERRRMEAVARLRRGRG